MKKIFFDLQRFADIYNAESNTLVSGTSDNDSIYNEWNDNVTIDAGDGADTISNYNGSNISINAGSDDDSINNNGEAVTVDGGAGDDDIENYGANVSINGGAGDDSINNNGEAVTIDGGTGNDYIRNDSSLVSIDGGDDNDYISNWGANVSINGGSSDDSIWNEGSRVTVDGGAGDDDIDNWYSDSVTIDGGAGDDYIYNYYGDNVSIAAGKGFDTISLGSSADKSMIIYKNGDGSDRIIGFNDNDTLKIADATYSTQVSGKHIIVTVGEEKISLLGAASLSALNIIPGFSNDSLNIVGTDGADSIKNSLDGATIQALGGNDSILNDGSDSVTIDAGEGDDSIYNSSREWDGEKYLGGWNVSINAGAGNDSIENYGADVSINGGSGNDYIRNYQGTNVSIDGGSGNDSIENYYGDSVTINAGAGDDTITNEGSNVSINAGAGNDSISNGGYDSNWNWHDGGLNVSINAGAGDDSIYLNGGSALINYKAGDGNDLITGFNRYSTLKISGGTYIRQISGDDLILTVGDGKITLQGAATSSTLNIEGEENKLLTGDDTYSNTFDGATIQALGGNDSIYNTGAEVSINAGSGDDTIYNSGGSNVTIDGGAGNDSILNDGSDSVTIDGGAGNDSILNDGSDSVTIDAGDGADTISNYNGGLNVSISAGAGDDYISSTNNSYGSVYVTILGGAGNDTIYKYYGDFVTISGGAGNDDIYNRSSEYVSIEAGEGNDTIDNSGGWYATIDAGDGNDFILSQESDEVSINAGSGDDSIYNYGSQVTIDAGEGNDSILNDGSDSVTIDGGAGDDSINNFGNKATLRGGAGADVFIHNVPKYNYSTDGVEITDYEEVDTIKFEKYAVTKVTVSDSDVVFKTDGEELKLKNAADKLIHYIDTDEQEKYYRVLTDGDDTYTNTLDNVAINPLGGNDLIRGFNATSTLSVDGDYRTAFAGDDLIVTTSVGSVTLEGVAASLTTVNINGEEVYMNSWHLDGTTATYGSVAETLVTIDGVKSLDGISLDGNTITIAASALNKMLVTVSDGYTLKLGSDVTKTSTTKNWSLDGTTVSYKQTVTEGYKLEDNSIVYSAPSVTTLAEIKGTTSLDGISGSGKTIKLAGSALSNNVTVSGDYTFDFASDYSDATITGSDSDDTIITRGKNISLGAGAGNDSIKVLGSTTTLAGGTGADVFAFKSSKGKNVVADYSPEDIVSLESGAANISMSGKDVIFTVGKEKVTVEGSKDKVITYVDATKEPQTYYGHDEDVLIDEKKITLLDNYSEDEFNVADYGDALQEIDATAVMLDLSITGNKFMNKITAGAGNDSLDGGKGNDTLTGGEGSDVFVYANGGGNDVVTDYEEEDTIKISAGSIKKISKTSSGSVVFTVGSGKLTLKDVGDKVVAYEDADGVKHFYPVDFSDDGTSVTLLKTYSKDEFNVNDFDEYKSSVETIDASKVSQDLSITGNKLANVITGGKGNDSLDGGKGNDTLTGGEGSDVFVYANGGGNDVVTDYDEEDTIKISKGSIKKISKTSSGSLVFTVGSGKLTLKDVDDKVVAYEDADGVKHFYPVDFSDDGASVKLLKTYSKDDFNINDFDEYKSSVETIDASAVNHDLTITGNKLANSIKGGKGDDTLIGGKGNDTLTGGDGSDVFVFDGNGNDIVTDYEEEDTIKISAGSIKKISKTSSGSVVFTVGSKKLTVKDVGDKVIAYEDADGVKHFYPVDFSDDGTSVTLLKTYSKDDFNVNDFDEYKSSVETIDASKVAYDLAITGNKLANSIKGGAGDDTLIGGKGNDTLTGGVGSDVFVFDGNGNDIVTDYEEEDTIKISAGSIKKISKTSAGSVVFTIGSKKLTVKDVGDKVIAYEDADGVKHFYPVDFSDDGASVTLQATYSKDDFNVNDFDEYKSSVETIDASAVNHDLTITGNKLANSIKGGKGDDTLIGGKGNDTLTGGDGSDVFVFDGNGNDIVTDYEEEDTIKISAGSIKKISKTSAGSVVFTIGSKKLTVKDVGDKVIAYEDADGVKHFYPVDFSDDGASVKLLKTYSKDDFNVNDFDEYKSSVETIDASAVKHDLTITGNKLANVITGTTEDDYIDGQAGSDTLLGGKGNDELYGGKGNDSLLGGAGDDSLWGGVGNDTLLGGAGEDTFIYQDGDGKDVIADYAPDLDTVMILSGEVKSPKTNAAGDVIFKIGSKGQITFTDSANKYIELVDTSGNILKQYIPK